MNAKAERILRANEQLQRQLREKESEVRRLSVRHSLERDHKKLLSTEEHLRDALRVSDEFEAELVATRDREARLVYELDILKSAINLRDHPDLLRVADAEVRCGRLEQESRKMREEVVMAGERCKVFQESASKAAKELESLRRKCAQLNNELGKTVSELKQMYDEREAFLHEVDDASMTAEHNRKTIDRITDEAGKLRDELGKSQQQCERLTRELSDAQHEAVNARRTWHEGQRLLEASTKSLDEANVRVANVTTQLKLCEEQAAADAQRLATMHKTSDALHTENKRLRDEIAQLQSRTDEIDTVARRASLHEGERSKMATALTASSEQCAGLRAQVLTLEREKAEALSQLGEAQREIDALTNEINVMSRSLGERLETVEQERDEASSREAAVRRDLAAAQERIAMLTLMSTHHQHLNSVTAQATLAASSSSSERLAKLLQGFAPTPRRERKVSHGTSAHHHQQQQQQYHSPPPATHVNASDIALSPPTPLPASSVAARHA